MPLIQSKSKKAFSNNVSKEMDAGKPKDQSLAIAYSVQRKNAHKQKMAHGGEIKKPDLTSSDLMEDEERASSIADAILHKRKKMKMAEGGMVDLEDNAMEDSNLYDDLNAELGDEEPYSEASALQDLSSPEADDGSMASKIRAKLRMKQGL